MSRIHIPQHPVILPLKTMKQPHIEIFYADICGLCHKAMAYFRGRGLAFHAYEVHWDEQAEVFVDSEHSRAMRQRCGPVDFVPQIFINGRHIAGWRKLEPLIQSGELEQMLFPATPPAS
jgi:glutaredoxin